MSEPARHYYTRPRWACTACGEPWPCEPRRAAFLEKFANEKARLRAILGTLALDAEKDMPHEPKGEIYRRFVEWTYEPLHERNPSVSPRRNPGIKN